MKSTLYGKAPLFASLGLAATLGLASTTFSLAQDQNDNNGGPDAQRDQEHTLQAQQQNTFRGRIVSLVGYLNEMDPAAHEARPDQKHEDETKKSAKGLTAYDGSYDNHPLGFVVDETTKKSTTTIEHAASTDPVAGTIQTSEHGHRASSTRHDSKLCLLLFAPDKRHLLAKARTLCEDNRKAAGTADAGTGADQETDDSVDDDNSEDEAVTRPASPVDSEVTITGRRVMRDGLTAIFVEDIQGSTKLSSVNR